MPCFRGLAVSIHTPAGPLPEYSVQRQSRLSRIACFIPVPPPKIPDGSSNAQEQSSFAISITLLTPGQEVPYSASKPTPENPYPKPKVVGGSISPYRPLTASPHETVAAYIYFDGRKKEEVATLLRRGEETWVNSRWVGLPELEGGGLAEREFLFREVGLERWLNGLDLDGKDAAKKIEKRRLKMEKHRRKKEEHSAEKNANGGDGNAHGNGTNGGSDLTDLQRVDSNDDSQVEDIIGSSDDSDGEDDDPIPETAGQIKVALFRVLASGEVKRGEYAPQFDANDDEDDSGAGAGADVDHTTTFAKPRSLDPKSISTQTVSAIDPADRPWAVFTFMYRGERQLQRMGIISGPNTKDSNATKKSHQPDFAKLGPLKPQGTVGFVNFRDGNKKQGKKKKKNQSAIGINSMDDDDDDDDDEDDDEDDDIVLHHNDDDDKDGPVNLSPEELKQQKELAEGLQHIRLKRPHSADKLGESEEAEADNNNVEGTTSSASNEEPPTKRSTSPGRVNAGPDATSALQPTDPGMLASPMKKQRSTQEGQSAQDLLRKHMVAGVETKKEGLAQQQEQEKQPLPEPQEQARYSPETGPVGASSSPTATAAAATAFPPPIANTFQPPALSAPAQGSLFSPDTEVQMNEDDEL